MGWLAVIASSLLAYGPALAVFFLVVATKNILIIVTIAGSLVWTVAFLISSMLWWLFYPNIGYFLNVPMCVALVEGFRFLASSKYLEADEKIRRDKTWPSQMEGAVALGWGMGIMQIFVTMEGTLIEASGRGFLYSTSCGSLSTFYLEALLATPIIFSHIMQTILAFKAIREEDKKMVGIVLASHLIPSLFSILNSVGVEGLCALSLLSSYASTAALGYFTFKDMKEKSTAR